MYNEPLDVGVHPAVQGFRGAYHLCGGGGTSAAGRIPLDKLLYRHSLTYSSLSSTYNTTN